MKHQVIISYSTKDDFIIVADSCFILKRSMEMLCKSGYQFHEKEFDYEKSIVTHGSKIAGKDDKKIRNPLAELNMRSFNSANGYYNIKRYIDSDYKR